MHRKYLFKDLINRKRFYATSPYFLVWPLLRNRSNASEIDRLRALYCKVFWREVWSYSPRSIVRLLIHFVAWPVSFVRAAKSVQHSAREEVAHITGKSSARQILEQARLALTHSVSPAEYYMYELYLDSNRARVGDYVIRVAFTPFIYKILDRRSDFLDLTKRTIHDRCVEHGLPTVKVFAHVDRFGAHGVDDGSTPFPDVDLFIKPNRGKGGRDTSAFKNVGRDAWIGSDGERVNTEQLLAMLQRRAADRKFPDGFVVQPKISNHPKVPGIGGSALSTLRLYTMKTDEDAVFITYGILRFSSDSLSIVDNFHAGGYAAPVIDLTAGQLGAASRMGLTSPSERIDTHPSSGVKIAGSTVPFWDQVSQLVINAHRDGEFGRALLGWDVAVTETGPVIVECNGWPDLDIIQRAYQGPIGRSSKIGLILKLADESLAKGSHNSKSSVDAGKPHLDNTGN